MVLYRNNRRPSADIQQGNLRLQIRSCDRALTTPELAVASTAASFVALHPSGKYLYATRETSTGLARSPIPSIARPGN